MDFLRLEENEVFDEFTRETGGPRDPRSYGEQVTSRMNIEVTKSNREEVEFDITGIDVSLANSLRRVMLMEVPTMAIESVYVEENTGVMQDEVMAHRLGLIPIRADPEDFEDLISQEDATDANTIVFGLEVRAPANAIRKARGEDDAIADESAPGGARHTTYVTSSDLVWLPQGEQESFLADRPVGVCQPDILITKLRPGQSVALEAHGRKGIAKDHAKFSPVSTAAYRMMPRIELSAECVGERAEALVRRCPLGVFDIEDLGGVKTAVATRPRDCTMCRECVRSVDNVAFGEDMHEHVTLKRVADHFLFKVETAGQLAPLRIVHDAINVLKAKCEAWQQMLDMNGGQVSDTQAANPADAY